MFFNSYLFGSRLDYNLKLSFILKRELSLNLV